MLRKTVMTALLGVVCCASAARATEPGDYVIPLMFDGTLSGLREAYKTFDDGIEDPACADCGADRELRFWRAVTGAAMLIVKDDDGSIDSVLELAREFDAELLGDYWARVYDPCGLEWSVPRNRHDAYEIPDAAPDIDEIRNIIDASMLPDIVEIIADLDSISDSPGEPFRIFLDPNETLIFYGPHSPGIEYDLEIDYGEVLILKGLLTGLKGQLHAQAAHDMYVDANDRLVEKVYGGSLSINDDLLEPYPDFLKVLPTANDPLTDGAAVLRRAARDFIDAIDYSLAAMDYISGEEDFQEDDLLYMDPNDQRDWDRAVQYLTTLRESLEDHTVWTYPWETTRTFDVYNSSEILIGRLKLICDFTALEGDSGSFLAPGISPSEWVVDDFGMDGNEIWVDLENFENGWRMAFLDATLADDANSFSAGMLYYHDLDWAGHSLEVRGQGDITDVVDANINLNPLFGYGVDPCYTTPVSLRDLLPQFDEWNGILPGTMGHGLGNDATLGGVTPDMNQYDWQILADLQPGGHFYLDFVSPWQIVVDADTRSACS